MATTTYVPTPQTDEQPPTKGGNGSTILKAAVFIALAAIIGVLVYLLIQENKDEPTPKPPPTISSEAQVRDQAYKAGPPIAREAFQTLQATRTLPVNLSTQVMRDSIAEGLAFEKKQGTVTKGVDKLVSATPVGFDQQADGDHVTIKTCFSVGATITNKDGQNVRVAPDGTPAPPGTRLTATYYLVQPPGSSTYLVDQIVSDGKC